MATSSPNYPLLAIPASYFLGMIPHIYGGITLRKACGGSGWSNADPRTNAERVKSKVPPKIYAKCERARACHTNAHENFPLFAAAMIGGTVAGLPHSYLTFYAALYLLLRALYTVLYIQISRHQYSYIRTIVWTLGTSVSFWILVKSAMQ
ncbi:MAG: hypothetical protein M1824_004618 [Vezdaea acicularis]|nr:MAG: hypothetical protein M1824_004618 [Vezdaea acicularis]